MRRIVGILVLAVALLAIMPASAFALDYYVETTGADTNDGLSTVTAFVTIQHAVDVAAATPEADTVHVGAGTFTGTVNMRDGVSLSGAGAGSTTLNANGAQQAVVFNGLGAGETITGFTITGSANGINGGGIVCTSSSPTIRDTTITGNSAFIFGGGIVCLAGSSPTITSNLISGNSVTLAGGGIFCDASSAPVITNNTISGNRASVIGGGVDCEGACVIANNVIQGNSADMYGAGIVCSASSANITENVISGNTSGDYGGGILCNSGSPFIANNVINGNSANTNGAGVVCLSSAPMIVNNTIVGNSSTGAGGGVLCIGSTPEVILNCIVWGNAPSQVTGGPVLYSCVQGGPLGDGNIASDPLFRNAGAGDYRLSFGSPCIDAGQNDGAPATDILGITRPQPAAGVADMGAYELPVYVVTFDSQGGSAVVAQNVYEGGTVTVPSPPTRTGHTFGGWYSDAACTTAWDFATPITAARTLYAGWTLNSYAVTFDSQGGSAVAPQTIAHGSPVARPVDPSQAGYFFAGWYTDATATTAWDFAAGTVTAPMTLYAGWTPVVFSGMNSAYTMYVGERLSLDAKPDGGTWGWDPVYFSATFNSPATFTALRPGTTLVTYSLNGVSQSATVTILAVPVASAPASDLPWTGANLVLTWVAAFLAILLGIGARLAARRA